MALGPAHLDLLRHLDLEVPRSLDELHRAAGGARSTLRNRLKALEEAGLVEHRPERGKGKQPGFMLTAAGEARRDHPQAEPEEVHPRLPLPLVRELPRLHQALIELILCAAVMRYHRAATRKLASFLLFGRTQKLKTTVGEVAIILAGGRRDTDVIAAWKETRSSSTIRRGPRGEAKLRVACSSPVVCLDEFNEASATVRDACLLYLFGESTFSDETGTIELLATTVVTMNSLTSDPTKQLSIEAQTGFPEQRQRRMIMADMSGAEIPDKLKGRRVDEILRALEAAGPHSLPQPAMAYVPDDRVTELLRLILTTQDNLETINTVLLAQLVAGATGYFPDDKEKALRNVMWNVATCYETLGWLRADWKDRLALVLSGGGAVPFNDPSGYSRETEAPEPPTSEPDLEVVQGLTKIQARVTELGLSWEEALTRLSAPMPAERVPTAE
ncbi:MAG: helix-turn-helix transcriptional regulator, partial [Planctomycetota bacterium]|nr:helix-turn-helix transcriptional regulator [Planctomycetota bacterium]